MTVVLDSSAIIVLAVASGSESQVVESALQDDLCYMSPTTIAESCYLIRKYAGNASAEHWLDFMTSGIDIRVDPDATREILELAGMARELGASAGTAFSAALARKRNVPLLSSSPDLREIAELRFCSVRWI